MKKLLSLFAITWALTSLPALAQDKAIDDIDGAIGFIQTVAKDTQDIWSDSTLDASQRDQAFKDIFEKATDIDLLAKAMLGRHYRTASNDQKAKYLSTMKAYIIAEFDKRMTQIGFKELQITGTTPASGKRGHLFVKTKIARDEGAPILADWRVRKKDGIFQIVNLEVEGINLLITNRELFSSRI